MELKQLIITDSGIKVNYIFRKKTEFIDYKEIEKMTTTRITEERGTGRTDGYYKLEIELINDRILTFDEDQFENYNELKSFIYLNRKNSR
jgi:hypothetical protein